MTNLEKLFEEAKELDSEAFERLIQTGSHLPDTLELYRCEDCRLDHGGKCLAESGEDDVCPGSTAKWLDRECRRERLIIVDSDQ